MEDASRPRPAAMDAARKLKAKIAADELVLGMLITDHLWPGLIELCHNAGMDYAIVDQEHGPYSDQCVADACQIGRLMGFPVLARPRTTEELELRRLLDMGPSGLLLPCVESREHLDRVAQVLLMPPRGTRRPGGPGVAWVSDVLYDTWKTEFEEHLIV